MAIPTGLAPTSACSVLLFGLVYWYRNALSIVFQLLFGIPKALYKRQKVKPKTVTVDECTKSWLQPKNKLPHQKIIWAFWDKGEANLLKYSQQAVQSWKARNPSWRVIVLSDSNYQEYVAPDDLPSTYWSLQVQHRSDFVRLAVLKRYGGIYLDLGYFLCKGLDLIWEHAVSNNHFFITAPINLKSSNPSDDIPFFNNGFLMVPKPGNPVIIAWQKRAIEYYECPCSNMAEMKNHSAFRRVRHHFNDPTLGKFPALLPYWSMLWLLLDTIYYDPFVADYVQTHVKILPALRWTLPEIMIEVPYSKDLNRQIYDLLRPLPLIKRLIHGIAWMVSDSPEEAQYFVDTIAAMKFSSAFTLPLEVAAANDNTTASRVLRFCLDEARETVQASLDGVRPVRLASTPGITLDDAAYNGKNSRSTKKSV
jgi:Capsular polysaccharide synthesis protein